MYSVVARFFEYHSIDDGLPSFKYVSCSQAIIHYFDKVRIMKDCFSCNDISPGSISSSCCGIRV